MAHDFHLHFQRPLLRRLPAPQPLSPQRLRSFPRRRPRRLRAVARGAPPPLVSPAAGVVGCRGRLGAGRLQAAARDRGHSDRRWSGQRPGEEDAERVEMKRRAEG